MRLRMRMKGNGIHFIAGARAGRAGSRCAIARRRGRNAAASVWSASKAKMRRSSILRRKGYTVVARRWSSGDVPGDVDLIAWDGPMLCFVEVKTRTAHDLTPAESAVDRQKRSNSAQAGAPLCAAATARGAAVRFDVISVYLVPGEEREFVHFEAAVRME